MAEDALLALGLLLHYYCLKSFGFPLICLHLLVLIVESFRFPLMCLHLLVLIVDGFQSLFIKIQGSLPFTTIIKQDLFYSAYI